jgi:hypothetical protein
MNPDGLTMYAVEANGVIKSGTTVALFEIGRKKCCVPEAVHGIEEGNKT